MEFYLPVSMYMEVPEERNAQLPWSRRMCREHTCQQRRKGHPWRNILSEEETRASPFVFMPWWDNLGLSKMQKGSPKRCVRKPDAQKNETAITEEQKNKDWTKEMTLPGLKPEDIKVKALSKNRILVEGKKEGLFIMRYVYVPDGVDANTIKVSITKDGQLRLSAGVKTQDMSDDTPKEHHKSEVNQEGNEKIDDQNDMENPDIAEEKPAENMGPSCDDSAEISHSIEPEANQKNIELDDDHENECDMECEKYMTNKSDGPSNNEELNTEKPEEFSHTFDLSQFTADSVRAKVVGEKVIVQARQEEEADGCVGFAEFYRELQIPDDVDLENLTSKINSEGLLVVTAPRRDTRRNERDIPVDIQ